jgi:hypothetical protein
MIILSYKPGGRFAELHDIFFGIINSLKNLIQKCFFWPKAKGKLVVSKEPLLY